SYQQRRSVVRNVFQANRFNAPVVIAEKPEQASIQSIDKSPVHSERIGGSHTDVLARSESLESITAVDRRRLRVFVAGTLVGGLLHRSKAPLLRPTEPIRRKTQTGSPVAQALSYKKRPEAWRLRSAGRVRRYIRCSTLRQSFRSRAGSGSSRESGCAFPLASARARNRCGCRAPSSSH